MVENVRGEWVTLLDYIPCATKAAAFVVALLYGNPFGK
jgi:hypothetical protein